jgi:adenylate cyclase
LIESGSFDAYQEEISLLSEGIDEIRRQLVAFDAHASQHGVTPPTSILNELHNLRSRIQSIEKLLTDYDHERRNLKALVGTTKVINSSLDLATVLNDVMDKIIRLTGAQRAFLMLRDEHGEMDIVVARNWENESLSQGEYEISSSVVGKVISSGDTVLTTNATSDPRFGSQDSIVAFNLRSILCVPLKVKGTLTGVIYADNRVREGLFTQREQFLLSAFADQAAVALENAMLFASVQQSLDNVTELKTLMEDVFASITSGVITTDIDDRITLCNQAAETILGVPQHELIGSTLQDLIENLSSDLLPLIKDVKDRDSKYVGVEVQTRLGDRGLVELSLNISPLKTYDNKTRGIALVLEDFTEKRRLEAQRRLFERMVSPAVIDQLDPESLQLGGERTVITALFADIRGFTAFSEVQDPETLVGILNDYLSLAAEAVLNENGTIDKFLGDAVMAWFNAPIPQPDHTLRSVKAALVLRDTVIELRAGLPEEYRLSFGVGIHYGEALLGLIGTQRRLEYTAIGDCINIAKRLQENARPDQILISKDAAERVSGSIRLLEMGPIQAAGRAQPIEVFEVLGLIPGSESESS